MTASCFSGAAAQAVFETYQARADRDRARMKVLGPAGFANCAAPVGQRNEIDRQVERRQSEALDILKG